MIRGRLVAIAIDRSTRTAMPPPAPAARSREFNLSFATRCSPTTASSPVAGGTRLAGRRFSVETGIAETLGIALATGWRSSVGQRVEEPYKACARCSGLLQRQLLVIGTPACSDAAATYITSFHLPPIGSAAAELARRFPSVT